MDARELSKVDLNLLISLLFLLEERSVSRAAERLFITQPAMSKTLQRLRTLFDDRLFTRSSHGMQPTPRALALEPGLRDILGDISQLLTDSRFEPASYQGEITLALSEYIGVALLPSLMKKLNQQAPRLSLRVITRVENQLDELALGNLDFAIHIKQARYTSDYRVEQLGGSPPVVLMRDNHPMASAGLSLPQLAKYPLIRLYVSDREQLEMPGDANLLDPFHDHPRGVLEISHLLTALEVLRQTDYFMPAPAYVLHNADAARGITGLPVPQSVNPGINYTLVAHKRTLNSALHNWLWELLLRTIGELRPPQELKLRQRITAGSTDQPEPSEIKHE